VKEVVAARLVEGETLLGCTHEPSSHYVHVDLFSTGVHPAKPDILDFAVEGWCEYVSVERKGRHGTNVE